MPVRTRSRRHGGQRAHRGWSAALAGLLVLTVVGGGCSDDEGGAESSAPPAALDPSGREEVTEADIGAFPVREVDAAGPGTPLGGGITVPEGAVLLGVPFPDLVGGGYRALLLVSGDPLEVFNALGEQAGRQGMEGGESCLAQAGEMGCTAHLVDGADGESLTVSVSRRVTEAGVVSGAGLRYLPPGSGATEAVGEGDPTSPTQPMTAVTLPPGPVEPPPAGDIPAALRAPGSVARPLEPGSRLVGLPGPCACESSGWSFVVQLTGVTRDVLSAYGRQFADIGEAPDISDRRRDGVTLLGLRISDGKRLAEIRAVESDDGRDYAIVTVRGA